MTHLAKMNEQSIDQPLSPHIRMRTKELEQTLLDVQKQLFCTLQDKPDSSYVVECVRLYCCNLFVDAKNLVTKILNAVVGEKETSDLTSSQGEEDRRFRKNSEEMSDSSSLRIPPILPAAQSRIEQILDHSIIKTLLPHLIVSLCATGDIHLQCCSLTSPRSRATGREIDLPAPRCLPVDGQIVGRPVICLIH